MTKTHKLLWTLQILLALLFLFAGITKFTMPVEELTRQTSLSVTFLRFIGVVELLGGLGLVVPGLTGIRPGLVPLAAAGLVVVMIGATVLSLKAGPVGPALFPLVVGILLAFVAYGRSRLVPLPYVSRTPAAG